MKLTELIKVVAIQSGVSEQEIKSILDNTALTSVEVDDALSTKITAPRLTIDAAKNDPGLKKHFFAQALNGVDAEVIRTIQELGLDDAAKTEIEAQETSYKKVSALAKKVQALEAAKKAAPDSNKDALTKKIDDLNSELKTAKESFASREKQLAADFDNKVVNMEFDNVLSGFNYALPKDTPTEAVKAFGRTIAEKGLQEKGLKVIKKDGKLTLQTSEGTEYYDESNAKVDFNSFVQKTLANAKVLSASGTTQSATPQKQVFQSSTSTGDGLNTSEYDKAVSEVTAGTYKTFSNQ